MRNLKIFSMLFIVLILAPCTVISEVIYSDRAVFESQLVTSVIDDYNKNLYVNRFYSNAEMSAVLGETIYQSTSFSNQVRGPGYYCTGCNGSFLLDFMSTSVSDASGVFGVGLDIVSGENVFGTIAFVTFGDGSTMNYSIPDANPGTGDLFWGITDSLSISSIHFGLVDGGTNRDNSVQRMALDNLTIGSAVQILDSDNNCPNTVIPETTTNIYGGVNFPAGASSFADRVLEYDPAFGGGPVPDITSQDARQILGVPDLGDVSLGNGGRIIVRFLDNRLTGSNDSQPDLWIFEVGEAESTFVEISKNGTRWFSVGTATGFASGIDIDEFGFGKGHHFAFVRLTDDGDSGGGAPFVQGADLVAVGASSSAPPIGKLSRLRYSIQAHVGGLSQLIIRGNTMQWHHIKGTAPGLVQADVGRNSNSPTIVDSNQGPNIPWVPSGWPGTIGNGTHPESCSNVFNALTPVFPTDNRRWKIEKTSGSGTVRIVQQPEARNGFSLVIEFDDLKSGAASNLSGSGFYTIKLTPGG